MNANSSPSTITILGAGAMGSALATPLSRRGHFVRLWGTHLDDHLLDAIDAGKPHPRTNVLTPENIRTFRSTQLPEALDGADTVILSVASIGVESTVSKAAEWLSSANELVITSKGFAPDATGKIKLLPVAISDVFASRNLKIPHLVAVGGPCKANEVAAGRPTATVFASEHVEIAESVGALIQTDTYRVQAIADVTGLEIAAPMKNIYAIALGIADGLGEKDEEPWHNLKSAIFAQALHEIATLAEALGGSRETVYGLAGAGDLEVTGLSGRNKVYGARIGKGESAAAALDAMVRAEQTVEGVPSSGLAMKLVAQRVNEPELRFPLLNAISQILSGKTQSLDELIAAALPLHIR